MRQNQPMYQLLVSLWNKDRVNKMKFTSSTFFLSTEVAHWDSKGLNDVIMISGNNIHMFLLNLRIVSIDHESCWMVSYTALKRAQHTANPIDTISIKENDYQGQKRWCPSPAFFHRTAWAFLFTLLQEWFVTRLGAHRMPHFNLQ